MGLPNDASIYCSKCSGYNIGSECCICKSCLNKIIDEVFPINSRYTGWKNKVKELKEKLDCGGS